MDNNTFYIQINTVHNPVLLECAVLATPTPFMHVDRVADFNVMIVVLSGVIYVTESDTDYAVHAGELLFLKSGIRHYGKLEIPAGTRWFYAHFTSDDGGLPEYQEGSSNGEYSITLPKKLSVPEDYINRLIQLNSSFANSDPMSRLCKNAKLYEALLTLISIQQASEESLTDKLCHFLASHLDRSFSKELLSKQFYLSYSYLSATFKRDMGMSLGDYHNELRMKRACELLTSTEMSVGEIAKELGFEDMLYFSRRFNKTKGISPTEYRKNALSRY